MKRAVLYLRVSTIDQTTANQERELRDVAERAGWQGPRLKVSVSAGHGLPRTGNANPGGSGAGGAACARLLSGFDFRRNRRGVAPTMGEVRATLDGLRPIAEPESGGKHA